MSINVFNDSANIGPILDGIKNTIVAAESLITVDVDDTITPLPISAYGKTLLDSTSLADLRTQILENTNEEAIRLLDDGNSEINFYTSGTGVSNLRMQITDSNTIINNNLIMNNSKTQYLYDDTHTIGSERNKDNVKNSIWGLNNSASDFGTISLCAGGSQNKNNKSRVQLYGYGMAEKIQMLIGDNKLYTCSDTQNTFYRPIYVNWNGGNGKKITIQGGNCDYSLYTSSVFGGEINIAHNISYTPFTEVEGVTTNSLFTSKIIVSNQGIKFRHSDTVNTLPTTDIATFNNSAATFNKDVIIDGTNKLNFNSTNYIQNDANDHLNMVLATDKNYIANTTTDKSSYEYQINDHPILKMTRDLTTTPLTPNNKFQIYSGKLTVKDDSVAGGYIELERTGPSGVLAGYINYYNTSGRLFYTGFNSGGVGNPVHYMEDQCLSYAFKNYLGDIMKIVSHDGTTFNSTSDYVEIGNILKCPTIKATGSTLDLYADTHSIKNNAGTAKFTITNLTDTTFIDTASTHIKGNIFPSFNGGANIGVGANDANTKRYNNLYLYNSLDINGNSGAGDTVVILRDDSIADNTIRDNTYCSNMILGTIDAGNTSALGRGFLRLGAGYNSPNIIETYIDLYGANSTGSYQSIRHVVNNSEMFVIENNKAEFKNTLYTTHIYPSSAPTTNPHTASLYDIGTDTTRYRNIYLRDAPIHGSDMRLKKNIVPLENSLSTILKLQPKLFQWISSESGRNHIGFIAQDIEQIPELANTGYFCKSKDGSTMSLRSAELIPMLAGSIKDLYDIVSNSTDKPVIIKQEVKSTQDHKCNNIELISQLNSYELELLDCNSKVKELDSNIEELCEDNNILKIKNKGLEERIGKLELSNKQLLEKLENIDNKKDDNLLTEDDENSSVMDIMNQRFLELEARLIKTEKKNAKLVTTINKMLKEK